MPLPVYIYDVVSEIDLQNDLITAYINRKTGELTILTEQDYSALRNLDDGGDMEDLPPWQQELIPKFREINDSEDFFPLPSQYEVHKYQIMEDFIRSLEDGPMKEDLFEAIRDRGAFRRFRDATHRYDIENDWWDFKKNSIKQIAIDFLDSKGIPWTEVKPED